MFGIGGFEFFIILLFGFLIFGPDKLPEIAKTIGTAVSKFKKAQDEMSAVLKSEVLEASAKSPESDASPHSKEGANNSDDGTPETFAERKARYDKERAERKKQQKIEENRAAMRKDSAEHARELEEHAEKHAEKKSGEQQATEQAKKAEQEEQEEQTGQAKNASQQPVQRLTQQPAEADDEARPSKQPAITADQLYGNVPLKPVKPAKPATKPDQPSSKNEGE